MNFPGMRVSRRRVASGLRGIALLLCMTGMAGCARGPVAQASLPASAVTAPTEAARATTGDPVVDFVATAAPGGEATVQDPQSGQQATVRLLFEFDAASGLRCREFQLTAAGRPSQVAVACAVSGGWVRERPLTGAAMTATAAP